MPKFLPLCQIQIWTSSFFHYELMLGVYQYRERSNRYRSSGVARVNGDVLTDMGIKDYVDCVLPLLQKRMSSSIFL